jgi:hypothetical protein
MTKIISTTTFLVTLWVFYLQTLQVFDPYCSINLPNIYHGLPGRLLMILLWIVLLLHFSFCFLLVKDIIFLYSKRFSQMLLALYLLLTSPFPYTWTEWIYYNQLDAVQQFLLPIIHAVFITSWTYSLRQHPRTNSAEMGRKNYA